MSITSVQQDEIKFRETLQRLIDEGPFKSNRKPIWEALNITSAALSQYLQGQSRPRLETLVGLAKFFGVSLDYMILGREAPSTGRNADGLSMANYVDWALADLRSRAGAHTWMVTRIAQALSQQIDDAARNIDLGSLTLGGMIGDDETLVLESYSLETKVVTATLEYDILQVDGNPVAGRFARVVAANLMASPIRPYEFLLFGGDDRDWREYAHNYRKLLMDIGVPADRTKYCQFAVTDHPMFCGSAFYRLDVPALTRENPVLHETWRRYISEEGWFGFTMHPNSETTGDLLYDLYHLHPAVRSFEVLWGTAKNRL